MTARILNTTLTFLTLATFSPVFAAQPSNDELTRSCQNKTIVFNKEGERVGEKPNDFCAGYMQATLDALRHFAIDQCTTIGQQETNYLYSVYETYLRDKKALPSDYASRTLSEAFARAFNCK